MKVIKHETGELVEREKRKRWILYGTSWIPDCKPEMKKPEDPAEIEPMSGISAVDEPKRDERE